MENIDKEMFDMIISYLYSGFDIHGNERKKTFFNH